MPFEELEAKALENLGLAVSRETLERLADFKGLVEKWTAKINLVSHDSRRDFFRRHILDSAQIYPFAPISSQRWMDAGTGGGFPGVICAILGKQLAPNQRFTFVESDQRKSVFLRTAIHQLSLNAVVKAARIEQIADMKPDIISSRAFAPLDKLLLLVSPHLSSKTSLLLLKGASVEHEILEAQRKWRFRYQVHPGKVDPAGYILEIHEVERV